MERSIDFVVVFWGKRYRDFFHDLCLASLLAPNNLPAFSAPGLAPIDVRLIVCSTSDDFQAVAETPLFRLARSFARIEFIDIGLPQPGDRHFHMSLGHKLALRKITQAKSYGAFLAPDIVLADGSLRTLARHVRAGTRIVLAPAFRFDYATAVAQLERAGVLKPDQPLIIAPRALAQIAATSLHSELKRFEYDEDHFCDEPMHVIFTSPGIGLVLHAAYWAIAAADFSILSDIDDSILDHQTIDAEFINENLMSSEPVLLNDSDEYLMLPVTTEEDFPHAEYLVSDPYLSGHGEDITDERKTTFIRTFLFSAKSDASKRWTYRTPVHIHYRDLPEGLDPVATRSVSLIERALATAPLARPIYFFVAFRGEPLRSALMKHLLSSVMAPNNAPALAGGEGNRLFIACSETDKAHVIGWGTYCVGSFLTVEFIDIGEPESGESDRRLHEARKSVAARGLRNNAYLSFLEPNLLLSSGTIARVVELARGGCEAILAYAFPVNAAPLEAHLILARSMRPPIFHRAVHLSARSLAQHALAFRHPMYVQDWDGAWQAESPLGVLHRAPGGFVIQTSEWTVLLIDLGAVTGFGSGNVPNDFLERALAQLHARGRIHCVTDSDEIAIVKLLGPGLTRTASAPNEQQTLWVREIEKLARLAAALNEPALDPVYRKFLQIPVRWHGTDLSPLWDIITDRARSVVANAERHSASLLATVCVLPGGANSLERDAALERSLRDHYDSDAVIGAFATSGKAGEVVARLVETGAVAFRAPPLANYPALARLVHRLSSVLPPRGRRMLSATVRTIRRMKANISL